MRVYPDDDVYLIALSNLDDQPPCTAIPAPLGDLVWPRNQVRPPIPIDLPTPAG